MSEIQDKKMFLPFRVNDYQFAVSAVEVEAIIELPKYRSVPLTPESFMGVFSHRNNVVNLISLNRKFGITDIINSGYVILTKIESNIVGFHVDEIYKLISEFDIIHIKINWASSFGSFRNILLNGNEILIQTSFKQLFNTEDSKIVVRKEINVKATVKNKMDNSAKPESKPIKIEKPPDKKPIYVSNIENNNDIDKERVGMQKKQKIVPKQQKVQTIKKFTKPIVYETQSSLKTEQFGKKAKLISTFLWLVISIIIILIVVGIYFFNKEDRKIIYHSTENKSVPSKNLVQKSYNKPLIDSKVNKTKKVPKQVRTFAETPFIDQPLQNNFEKNKSNELTMYTKDKKEKWVKIEEKEQGSAQNINQSNDFKEKDVRIETNKFTLIIERQKLNEAETSVHEYDKSFNSDYQLYIVAPGDTLWQLAKRFLGNPFWYKELADSSMIKNPDLIYPGDKIHIIKKKD